jgi:4-hydroxybenzoate polyprenyltransferase
MVLNDWFDIEVDRAERPERPLPSGRVPRSHALYGGIVLLTLGLVAAILVHSTSRNVALMLITAVVLYDGLTKNTLLGPANMGLCRGLNVLLGMSSHAGAIWLFDLSSPNAARFGTMAAAGVGLYIMGVTRFARREVSSGSRGDLASSAMGYNIGLLLVAMVAWSKSGLSGMFIGPGDPYWMLADTDPDTFSPMTRLYLGAAIWGAVVLTTNVMVWRAVDSEEPKLIQQAVKTCIVSLIALDASVVALVNGPIWAAVLLVLLVPTLTLGRWVYST